MSRALRPRSRSRQSSTAPPEMATRVLVDFGLSPKAVAALRTLGYDVLRVGDEGAPPGDASDAVNVAWCELEEAVLATTDKGRGDKQIIEALHHAPTVGAVFVGGNLP